MAEKRDYYEVLGVPRNATEDVIRRAFRKLAFDHHPDRNAEPNAADRFKEINEAYEVLSDREKRQIYDRFGHAGPQGFGAGGVGFGIEDIFETFFGASARGAGRRPRRSRRRAPPRGRTGRSAGASPRRRAPRRPRRPP